ncbi:MAG: C39 family peptidase [Patescibacteria group bacterium]
MTSGKTIITPLLCLFLLSACGLKEKVKNKTDDISRQPTTIKSDGLPDKHLISTTFVPQAPEKNWSQPWQDACEEAAILTVHYYLENKTPDLATMIKDYEELLAESTTRDINLEDMGKIAKDLYGYQPQIIENPTIEDIKTFIAVDTPVIIPANGKTLFSENKHFKNGGPWYHNLVILGYDDDKKQFTVHDVGTQFGAYFRYSYATLMDSIHDFPDSKVKEEINDGQKIILVLLK